MKKTVVLASTALLALALSFGSVQVSYAQGAVKPAVKTEKVTEVKAKEAKKECCDKSKKDCCDKSKECKKDKDCKGTCDNTKKCNHEKKAKKSK